MRHRPERTLLDQLIEKYYPVFEAQCTLENRVLPDYVRQEFKDYLIAIGPQQGRKVFTLQTLPACDLDEWFGNTAGKGNKTKSPDGTEDQSPFEQRVSMNRTQRLKRVFNRDIEICSECGGAVKVIIACIEDPVVIKKIFTDLKEQTIVAVGMLPEARAPPQESMFD